MTGTEFAKITCFLKSAYQRFPSYVKSLNDDDVLVAQYEMLKDLSYEQVSSTVMAWCQRESFPPTIADIRGSVADIKTDALSESDAWRLFLIAVKKYNYNNSEELYKQLGEKDKVLEKVARNMSIKEIAMSPIENQMADRAHFIKMYQIEQARRKEDEVLSPQTRDMIKNLVKTIPNDQSKQKVLEGD